jgi:glycosyltransferase involved in cell wall biosynthesis
MNSLNERMQRMMVKDFESKCLTVIIPCFNEEKTIREVLVKVLKQSQVGEVIVIDDCSTDSSVEKIRSIKDDRVQLCINEQNYGKGKSIWRGIKLAQLKYLIIQDADLEYDPDEYASLMGTIIENSADAVYGSRFLTSGPRRAVYFWHRIGNFLLTTTSNAFTNVYLTDMETGHKLLRTAIAKQLNLKENRFGVEPEITAKLARLDARIYEVPIKYNARTYAEGKKIGWKDGFSALRCIIKYSIVK